MINNINGLEPPQGIEWELVFRGHIDDLYDLASDIKECFKSHNPQIQPTKHEDVMVITMKWNSVVIERLLASMIPDTVKLIGSRKY